MVRHHPSTLVAAAGLALACNDAGGPAAQFRPLLEIVAGDAQIDTVARELPTAITARVVDSVSRQVKAGVLVNWVVIQGGGSVFAGAAITNDSGLARERWTLGTTAGPQRLEARAVDATTGQPIVFAQVTATAMPGPIAYAGFVVPVLRVLGDSLVPLPVDAEDAYGNAVAVRPRSLDSLRAGAVDGQIRWMATALGAVRFTLTDPLGTDTLHIYVSPPARPFRAAYRIADSTFMETGQIVFNQIDTVGSQNACYIYAGVGRTLYTITNLLSIRTAAGTQPDTIQVAQLVGGLQHVAADTAGAWYASPRLTGCTHLDFSPTGGTRWRFVVSGVAADTLVIGP